MRARVYLFAVRMLLGVAMQKFPHDPPFLNGHPLSMVQLVSVSCYRHHSTGTGMS